MEARPDRGGEAWRRTRIRYEVTTPRHRPHFAGSPVDRGLGGGLQRPRDLGRRLLGARHLPVLPSVAGRVRDPDDRGRRQRRIGYGLRYRRVKPRERYLSAVCIT